MGREEVYLQLLLNLGTRLTVSGQRHAPAALYPRGKEPWYPLDRRLGGPQNRSTPVGDRTPIVQPVVRHYTAWVTAALIIISRIKIRRTCSFYNIYSYSFHDYLSKSKFQYTSVVHIYRSYKLQNMQNICLL
jgi:hypothetical protein